jgi:cytoskeletal protein CcmA (bactofilin family)
MASDSKGFGLGSFGSRFTSSSSDSGSSSGSAIASVTAAPETYAPVTSTDESYSSFGGAPHPVITEDVEIRGELAFSGELEFNGRFEGHLESDGVLRVGEKAIIKGGISAESAIIAGRVQGDVTVTGRAHLRAQALILGDIHAAVVIIEEGAWIEGKVYTTAQDREAPDFSNMFARLGAKPTKSGNSRQSSSSSASSVARES